MGVDRARQLTVRSPKTVTQTVTIGNTTTSYVFLSSSTADEMLHKSVQSRPVSRTVSSKTKVHFSWSSSGRLNTKTVPGKGSKTCTSTHKPSKTARCPSQSTASVTVTASASTTITSTTTVTPAATTTTVYPCATLVDEQGPAYGDAQGTGDLGLQNDRYELDTPEGESAQSCCNTCFFELESCVQAYWYSYQGCVVSLATNATAGSGRHVSANCPAGVFDGLTYGPDTMPAFRSTGNIAGPCGVAYANF